MSVYSLIWIAALAVFVLVEMMTAALTTIWFAGGALCAGIVSFAGGPVWLQVIVFLAVSVLLLILTRPLAEKYVNSRTVKTNAQSVIGKEAVASADINNLQQTGQVLVSGQEWTARTDDNDTVITKGTVVVVERIEGVKLIVRPKEQ